MEALLPPEDGGVPQAGAAAAAAAAAAANGHDHDRDHDHDHDDGGLDAALAALDALEGIVEEGHAAARPEEQAEGGEAEEEQDEDEVEPPPEALGPTELLHRCEERMLRIQELLDDYDASYEERMAAFRNDVEEAYAAREPRIKPHHRQSYFSLYFSDEKGGQPPIVGATRAVTRHLRKLQEAREETGWSPLEEKKFKALVLEEKARARTRLGLGPAGRDGAAPLLGRMTSAAQLEENERVEAAMDWRGIADRLKPYHPKRLKGQHRSVKELVTHWRNKVGAPDKFTREDVARLMALAEKHRRHEWEAVARELGTGHAAVQCLREYQRQSAKGRAGGGLFKRGSWTADEDARLAEAVAMYADNWTLISQHVQTRTSAQCRFRRNSQLLNKRPFSREEQMRLICAVAAYVPESWRELRDGSQQATKAMDDGEKEGPAWSSVALHVPTRNDAQCRSRWYGTLHPYKRREEWTDEELDRLWDLVQQHGAKDWVTIARELGNGRTRQQCKLKHKRMAHLENIERQMQLEAAAGAGARGDGAVATSAGAATGGRKRQRALGKKTERAAASRKKGGGHEQDGDDDDDDDDDVEEEEDDGEQDEALQLGSEVRICRRPNGRPYLEGSHIAPGARKSGPPKKQQQPQQKKSRATGLPPGRPPKTAKERSAARKAKRRRLLEQHVEGLRKAGKLLRDSDSSDDDDDDNDDDDNDEQQEQQQQQDDDSGGGETGAHPPPRAAAGRGQASSRAAGGRTTAAAKKKKKGDSSAGTSSSASAARITAGASRTKGKQGGAASSSRSEAGGATASARQASSHASSSGPAPQQQAEDGGGDGQQHQQQHQQEGQEEAAASAATRRSGRARKPSAKAAAGALCK